MLEDDGKFVTLDYSVYQMSPVEISAFDPIRLVLGLRKMSFGNFNIKKLLPEIDGYSYGKDFYRASFLVPRPEIRKMKYSAARVFLTALLNREDNICLLTIFLML